MAPIPARLTDEVQSLIASIERRYKYISETSVPELRKCTGPVSLQQRLAEDVREDTVTLARQIEVSSQRSFFAYISLVISSISVAGCDG